MAIYTLEKLFKGEANIVENYNNARHFGKILEKVSIFN